MPNPLPKVDFAKLAEAFIREEQVHNLDLIGLVLLPGGQVRASMKPPKTCREAEAFYVWRMLVFEVSPMPRHQCMPYGADIYLEGDFNSLSKTRDRLHKVVDLISDAIPAEQHYGLMRWSGIL